MFRPLDRIADLFEFDQKIAVVFNEFEHLKYLAAISFAAIGQFPPNGTILRIELVEIRNRTEVGFYVDGSCSPEHEKQNGWIAPRQEKARPCRKADLYGVMVNR